MCQCGCGEFPVENAYELPDGQVVGYGIYRGCADCNPGPGISIYVYPDRKSEWLEQAEIEPYEPSEFGGNGGSGISFGLFEVEDLQAEAKDLTDGEGATIGRGRDQYRNIEDWLEDYGLRMVQGAMRRYASRT